MKVGQSINHTVPCGLQLATHTHTHTHSGAMAITKYC